MRLVAVASEILNKTYDGRPVRMLFIDGTGVGGPIKDRLQQLNFGGRVTEVQFGAESPDPKYANMRAYMWGKMRVWLERGCIDTAPRLESDLTGPGYSHDKRDRVLLESKEHMKARGVDSPDDGDALALTFAYAVNPAAPPPPAYKPKSRWG